MFCVIQQRGRIDNGCGRDGAKDSLNVLGRPFEVYEHEAGQNAFHHDTWLSAANLPLSVTVFLEKLLNLQSVGLFNNGGMVSLNEILRFQPLVFYRLMSEGV